MKIVLDPGHGGFDPGACANGYREADVALEICLIAERELKAAGHQVILTRRNGNAPKNATNKQQELKARVDISDNYGADLFCSVHLNAGGGTGSEALLYDSKTIAYNIGQQVIDNLTPLVGVHGNVPIKYRQDLYVLKNTNAPALLVEVGYIDNVNDINKIKNNIELIGKMIAAGLMKKSYQGVKAMGNVNQTVPEWGKGAWGWTQNVGPEQDVSLMDGTRPNDPITRAEFATVLHRFYKTLKKESIADHEALEKQVAELKK